MNKDNVVAPEGYIGPDNRAAFKVGVGGHALIEVETVVHRDYEDKETKVTRTVAYLAVRTLGGSRLTRNKVEEQVTPEVPLLLKLHGSLAKEMLFAIRARECEPVMTREQFVEWAQNIDEEVRGVRPLDLLNRLAGEKFFIERHEDVEGENGRRYSRYSAQVAPASSK